MNDIITMMNYDGEKPDLPPTAESLALAVGTTVSFRSGYIKCC